MNHFIEKCESCTTVISQCRCPSKDKEVRYSRCEKCKAAAPKIDERKQYDFTCPKCGKEQWLHKSMAMECGLNSGHGSCLECKTFLHLEIVPDLEGDHAKATDFQEYLKTLPAKNDNHEL